MKHYRTFLPLVFCFTATAASLAADPVELVTARGSYQKQIKAVTDPINTRYLQYLDSLKKTMGARGDLDGALAVQKEIDSLGLASAGTAKEGNDRIVIWNQNNGGKADRGTKKLNVSLWVGTREVWSKKSVKIDWDASKQTKVEIPVPTMSADKLRVEVTEFVEGRGACLAEVEFFKGGRNVALNAAVAVSAVWENDQKHTGAKLTDGDPNTWWTLPDRQPGWAEISLSR